MRSSFAFITSVLFAFGAGEAQAWEFEDVKELHRTLEDEAPSLVALVADPSDQRSRDLEVEWAKIAEQVGSARKLAHHCTSETQLCREIEKAQFPRVVFFTSRDEVSYYEGPRSSAEIKLFAQRMQQPVVTRLDSSSAETLMNEHDGVCVCTACPDKHGELVAVFDSVAQQYHGEYTFGFMELPGSSDSEPRVECLNQIGGKKKTYAQDGRGLEAFVLEALRPTIVDLTPDSYERLLNRRWPMIYLFGNSLSQRTSLRREFSSFASSWPDLTTVLVDPLDFPDLPAKLGLENKEREVRYPAGAVHQLTTGKIWPYPLGKALDKDSLQKWGMDVWQGKVRPWNSKVEQKTNGQKSKIKSNQGKVKSHRQVKLPNVPGMEELRKKLEARDEL